VLSRFDVHQSLSVARERPELAAEFLQILILNLPADQEQINISFKKHDDEALRRSVHKLNGAVKYCGVPRLANAIDKLESIVKTASKDHAGAALNLLNSEIDSLLEWYCDNPDPFGKQADRAEST
jgi:two-component system sensor histidine kinase BarA